VVISGFDPAFPEADIESLRVVSGSSAAAEELSATGRSNFRGMKWTVSGQSSASCSIARLRPQPSIWKMR